MLLPLRLNLEPAIRNVTGSHTSTFSFQAVGQLITGIDAVLAADASFSGNASVVFDVASTLSGGGALVAEVTLGVPLTTSLTASGDFTSDAVVVFGPDSLLQGGAIFLSTLAGSTYIDAILDGSADLTPNATVAYAGVLSLSGGGDVDAPELFDQFNFPPLSLDGDGQVSSDLVASFALGSALVGGASVAAQFDLSAALSAQLSAASTLNGVLLHVISTSATLSAGATVASTLAMNVSSTLDGSSSVAGLLNMEVFVTSTMGGSASVDSSILWIPHPGKPPPMPQVNSAVILAELRRALGLSREEDVTLREEHLMLVVPTVRKELPLEVDPDNPWRR